MINFISAADPSQLSDDLTQKLNNCMDVEELKALVQKTLPPHMAEFIGKGNLEEFQHHFGLYQEYASKVLKHQSK